MRLVILTPTVYPYFKGGVEKRHWDIATNLVKNGHDVSFLCGQWPEMEKNLTIEGVNIKSVYKVVDFYVDGKKSIVESIKYSIGIIKPLLTLNYDIVECDQFPLLHIIPARLITWIRQKKLIVTWHEVWGKYWFEYIGWKGSFGYLIEKIVTKCPNVIISVSKHTTDALKRITGVSRKKIETIPNGIDLHKLYSAPIADEQSDIIFVGRLMEHKNLSYLIDSVEMLKSENTNIKCVVVGDGPEKENLENLCNSKNLQNNIIFKGFLENIEDAYSLMKSSKVYVTPSTREGFGIAVLEANACGLPVITIDHKENAARFLIEDNINGFKSDLDAEDIANKTKLALDSYQQMKDDCVEYAAKYDLSKVVKEVENLYKSNIS
jgi:glycosyltransferase involved in cell wall biosynthesis